MSNTINFSVHANPLKDAEGNETFHVRQDTLDTVHREAFIAHLKRHYNHVALQVDSALTLLEDEIPEFLADNHRLRIDGIGTFFLKLGFRERVDEEGNPVKQHFTNPEDITGNDVCVETIGFIPDQSLVDNVRRRAPYFSNSKGRGVVGHSALYTNEQLLARLAEWFQKSDYITVRYMRMYFGLTDHTARKYLKELSEGPHALLEHRKINNTHTYWVRSDRQQLLQQFLSGTSSL
jgi:hypothetical protein